MTLSDCLALQRSMNDDGLMCLAKDASSDRDHQVGKIWPSVLVFVLCCYEFSLVLVIVVVLVLEPFDNLKLAASPGIAPDPPVSETGTLLITPRGKSG